MFVVLSYRIMCLLTFKDETPLIATMGIMVAGMIGLVALRISYQRTNKKRSKMIEEWDEDRFEEEASSELRRGDQRLTFMYGL